MLWILAGVAVVLVLVWLWRIDRRDNGTSRLGWGRTTKHRVNNRGWLGNEPSMNGTDQLVTDAFAAADRADGGPTAPRPSHRDEQQARRRLWQREPGRSSDGR